MMKTWGKTLIRDAVIAALLYGLYTDNQGINNIAVVFLWVYWVLLVLAAISDPDLIQMRLGRG